MIKHKDHFHGSDLEAIEKCYHIKKEDIISFSANVNPLGISYQLRSTPVSYTHLDVYKRQALFFFQFSMTHDDAANLRIITVHPIRKHNFRHRFSKSRCV